ncbi:MAG: hypothetical protein COV45_02170 [Deltaproteobacteria bacterium CG11_big_fil_rev_8_21_14_0_20_47_16]|nr:MAG: hypothetical protein COV45_02170 [Deltaproteobacteria bacterium CG11_big_fil_rev_8_21_14_0_20_47_16]
MAIKGTKHPGVRPQPHRTASKTNKKVQPQPTPKTATPSALDTFLDTAKTTAAQLIRPSLSRFTTGVAIAYIAGRGIHREVSKITEPIIESFKALNRRGKFIELQKQFTALQKTAEGLPEVYQNELTVLAPDLKELDDGLNVDALEKDLRRVAFFMSEYQKLGTIPNFEGLANDAPERYQAAWTKALATADHHAQHIIYRNHQIIAQRSELNTVLRDSKLPESKRGFVAVADAMMSDLSNPLTDAPGLETAADSLIATTNAVRIHTFSFNQRLYAHQVARQFSKTARQYAEAALSNPSSLWKGDAPERAQDMVAIHEALTSTAVTAAAPLSISSKNKLMEALSWMADHDTRRAFLDNAQNAGMPHKVKVALQYAETVLAPRHHANDRWGSLVIWAGEKDSRQLEYTQPGWNNVPTHILNNNPITKAFKNVGNSTEENQIRLAYNKFIDPYQNMAREIADITLNTDNDWQNLEETTTTDSLLLTKLHALLDRADTINQRHYKPDAIQKHIQFLAAANRIFGADGRSPGHTSDGQAMNSLYDISSDMLAYMKKNYPNGISHDTAKQRLLMVAASDQDLETRRNSAAVYEYYLLQEIMRSQARDWKKLLDSPDPQIQSTAKSEFTPLTVAYNPSARMSIEQALNNQSAHQSEYQPLVAKSKLTEYRNQLLAARDIIQDYTPEGRSKTPEEKFVYQLTGGIVQAIKYRGQNLDPLQIDETLSAINHSLEDLHTGHTGSADAITFAMEGSEKLNIVNRLVDEAVRVNIARDIMREGIGFTVATVATAGVGTVIKLGRSAWAAKAAVKTLDAYEAFEAAQAAAAAAKAAGSLTRVARYGKDVLIRQLPFLHIKAGTDYVLFDHQTLYNSKGSIWDNAIGLAGKVLEFETMHQVRGVFTKVWEVAPTIKHTGNLKSLKTLASFLRRKSHEVVRDTVFFHGWAPVAGLGTTVLTLDPQHFIQSVDTLFTLEGLEHSFMMTVAMGHGLGEPLARRLSQAVLRRGIPEVKKAEVNRQRIEQLERQIGTIEKIGKSDQNQLKILDRIAELRNEQRELAEENAHLLEIAAKRHPDIEELHENAKQNHLMAGQYYHMHQHSEDIWSLKNMDVQEDRLRHEYVSTHDLHEQRNIILEMKDNAEKRIQLAEKLFSDGLIDATALNTAEDHLEQIAFEERVLSNAEDISTTSAILEVLPPDSPSEIVSDHVAQLLALYSIQKQLITESYAAHRNQVKGARRTAPMRYPPDALRKVNAAIKFLTHHLEAPQHVQDTAHRYEVTLATINKERNQISTVRHRLANEVGLLRKSLRNKRRARENIIIAQQHMLIRHNTTLAYLQDAHVPKRIIDTVKAHQEAEARLLHASLRHPELMTTAVRLIELSERQFHLMRLHHNAPNDLERHKIEMQLVATDQFARHIITATEAKHPELRHYVEPLMPSIVPEAQAALNGMLMAGADNGEGFKETRRIERRPSQKDGTSTPPPKSDAEISVPAVHAPVTPAAPGNSAHALLESLPVADGLTRNATKGATRKRAEPIKTWIHDNLISSNESELNLNNLIAAMEQKLNLTAARVIESPDDKVAQRDWYTQKEISKEFSTLVASINGEEGPITEKVNNLYTKHITPIITTTDVQLNRLYDEREMPPAEIKWKHEPRLAFLVHQTFSQDVTDGGKIKKSTSDKIILDSLALYFQRLSVIGVEGKTPNPITTAAVQNALTAINESTDLPRPKERQHLADQENILDAYIRALHNQNPQTTLQALTALETATGEPGKYSGRIKSLMSSTIRLPAGARRQSTKDTAAEVSTPHAEPASPAVAAKPKQSAYIEQLTTDTAVIEKAMTRNLAITQGNRDAEGAPVLGRDAYKRKHLTRASASNDRWTISALIDLTTGEIVSIGSTPNTIREQMGTRVGQIDIYVEQRGEEGNQKIIIYDIHEHITNQLEPRLIDRLKVSLKDTPIIAEPLKDDTPPSSNSGGGGTTTGNENDFIEFAGKSGIALSSLELKALAQRAATEDIDIASENTLGAITRQNAFEALVNRMRFLKQHFGLSDVRSKDSFLIGTALDNHFSVQLELGQYEAYCGMQLSIYQDGVRVATVGFQETNKTIDIVRYQGSNQSNSEREASNQQFKQLSGGINPMPWLALATGQLLLKRAQTSGKELRWIGGDYIVYGYPHETETHPGFSTIEEARAIWTLPQPKLEAMGVEYDSLQHQLSDFKASLAQLHKQPPSDQRDTEIAYYTEVIERLNADISELQMPVEFYRRGPHTEKLYNITAQNLGFRRKGKLPWHRFTKDPSQFGNTLRDKADSQQLNLSFRGLADIESVLTPQRIETPSMQRPTYPPIQGGAGGGFGPPRYIGRSPQLLKDGHFDTGISGMPPLPHHLTGAARSEPSQRIAQWAEQHFKGQPLEQQAAMALHVGQQMNRWVQYSHDYIHRLLERVDKGDATATQELATLGNLITEQWAFFMGIQRQISDPNNSHFPSVIELSGDIQSSIAQVVTILCGEVAFIVEDIRDGNFNHDAASQSISNLISPSDSNLPAGMTATRPLHEITRTTVAWLDRHAKRDGGHDGVFIWTAKTDGSVKEPNPVHGRSTVSQIWPPSAENLAKDPALVARLELLGWKIKTTQKEDTITVELNTKEPTPPPSGAKTRGTTAIDAVDFSGTHGATTVANTFNPKTATRAQVDALLETHITTYRNILERAQTVTGAELQELNTQWTTQATTLSGIIDDLHLEAQYSQIRVSTLQREVTKHPTPDKTADRDRMQAVFNTQRRLANHAYFEYESRLRPLELLISETLQARLSDRPAPEPDGEIDFNHPRSIHDNTTRDHSDLNQAHRGGLQPPPVQGGAGNGRASTAQLDRNLPPQLGIVGGDAGKLPRLSDQIPPKENALNISSTRFATYLDYHFPSTSLTQSRSRKTRDIIIAQLQQRETDITKQKSIATRSATSDEDAITISGNAYLARTEARAATFAQLLELRVDDQLRTKFSPAAKFTDMDLEAERNRILAEVLSSGFGSILLGVAKHRIHVSHYHGILVLDPTNEADYTAINRAADKNTQDEMRTGGFFHYRSALGIPIIVINPTIESRQRVLIHELQHLHKHHSNSFEPGNSEPKSWRATKDGRLDVKHFLNSARDHFNIGAKDETLAYLMEGTPPEEVIKALKEDAVYDYIGKEQSKLINALTPDFSAQKAKTIVRLIRKRHDHSITTRINLLYDAVEQLVDYGFHPEVARQEMARQLHRVPYHEWPKAISDIVKQLKTQPPKGLSALPQDETIALRAKIDAAAARGGDTLYHMIGSGMSHWKQWVQAMNQNVDNGLPIATLEVLRQKMDVRTCQPAQTLDILYLRLLEAESRQEVLLHRRPTPTKALEQANQEIKMRQTLYLDAKEAFKKTGWSRLLAKIDRQLIVHTAHSKDLIQRSADAVLAQTSDIEIPPSFVVDRPGMGSRVVVDSNLPLQQKLHVLLDGDRTAPQDYKSLQEQLGPQQWHAALIMSTPEVGLAPHAIPTPKGYAHSRLVEQMNWLRGLPTHTPETRKLLNTLHRHVSHHEEIPMVGLEYVVNTDDLLKTATTDLHNADHYYLLNNERDMAHPEPNKAIIQVSVPLNDFLEYQLSGKSLIFLSAHATRMDVVMHGGEARPELVSLARKGQIALRYVDFEFQPPLAKPSGNKSTSSTSKTSDTLATKLPGLPSALAPESNVPHMEVSDIGAPWIESLLKDAKTWIREHIATEELKTNPTPGRPAFTRSARKISDLVNMFREELRNINKGIVSAKSLENLETAENALEKIKEAHEATLSAIDELGSETIDLPFRTALLNLARIARSQLGTLITEFETAREALQHKLSDPNLPKKLTPEGKRIAKFIEWFHTVAPKSRHQTDPHEIQNDPGRLALEGIKKLEDNAQIPDPAFDVLDHHYRNEHTYHSLQNAWKRMTEGGRRPSNGEVKKFIALSKTGIVMESMKDFGIDMTLPVAIAGHDRTALLDARTNRESQLHKWARRESKTIESSEAAISALDRGMNHLAERARHVLDHPEEQTDIALRNMRDDLERYTPIYTEIKDAFYSAGHRDLSNRVRDLFYAYQFSVMERRIADIQTSISMHRISERRDPTGGGFGGPLMIAMAAPKWIEGARTFVGRVRSSGWRAAVRETLGWGRTAEPSLPPPPVSKEPSAGPAPVERETVRDISGLPPLSPPMHDVSHDMRVHLAPFVDAILATGERAKRDTEQNLDSITQELKTLESGRPPTMTNLNNWRREARRHSSSGYKLYVDPNKSATFVLDPEAANTMWQKDFTEGVRELLPDGVVPGIPVDHTGSYFIPGGSHWFWGGNWFRSEEERIRNPYEGRIFFGVDYGRDGQRNIPKASVLYATLTTMAKEWEKQGIDVQFKITAKRQGRNDAGVLYFHAKDQQKIYTAMCAIAKLNVTQDHLPLFVAPLTDPSGNIMPGIGFAQHPKGGQSFGERRISALQEARKTLSQEVAQGNARSRPEIEGILTAQLRDAGIDPEVPAFDAGGKEKFLFLRGHMRFSATGDAPTQQIVTPHSATRMDASAVRILQIGKGMKVEGRNQQTGEAHVQVRIDQTGKLLPTNSTHGTVATLTIASNGIHPGTRNHVRELYEWIDDRDSGDVISSDEIARLSSLFAPGHAHPHFVERFQNLRASKGTAITIADVHELIKSRVINVQPADSAAHTLIGAHIGPPEDKEATLRRLVRESAAGYRGRLRASAVREQHEMLHAFDHALDKYDRGEHLSLEDWKALKGSIDTADRRAWMAASFPESTPLPISAQEALDRYLRAVAAFYEPEDIANQLIDAIGIRHLLPIGQETQAPTLVLNRFLRGELGRLPTKAEVDALSSMIKPLGHHIRKELIGEIEGSKTPRIFQIYNEEFITQMAQHIQELATEFERTHGRPPVIAELAAGDGRLTQILNDKLKHTSIRITATDNGSWDTHRSQEVVIEDAAATAQRADIILGSWWPIRSNFDVQVANHLATHPDKTLVLIEAEWTCSPKFWERLQHQDLTTQHSPRYEDLMTSKSGFGDYQHEEQTHVITVHGNRDKTKRPTTSPVDANHDVHVGNNTQALPPKPQPFATDSEDTTNSHNISAMGALTLMGTAGGAKSGSLFAMADTHSLGLRLSETVQAHPMASAATVAALALSSAALLYSAHILLKSTAQPATRKGPTKNDTSIPAHSMDHLPRAIELSDPIWLSHVNRSLSGRGSFQDAYRHLMHNAYATRWDANDHPTQFNFESNPWGNPRFALGLRAVRQAIAREFEQGNFMGIQTADNSRSFYIFNNMNEFDEFVTSELQRISQYGVAPPPPKESDAVDGAQAIDLSALAPRKESTLFVEGVDIPREYSEGDRIEIGRDGSNNDISFPMDDLVSRTHALITFQRNGEFVGRVTDLASSNGTKVIRNGIPTVLHEGDQYPLKVGDIIQVGTHRIFVGQEPPSISQAFHPNEPEPSSIIPVRYRDHGANFRSEYQPQNRNTQYIWQIQKGDAQGRKRLIDIFHANAERDPNQRRWPINFVVQADPNTPGKSQVLVGQRFWRGQSVMEEGVKHIQIANGGYAQWAGELRGLFDAQGQLIEVQFNANSGEFGRQSLSASQDDDIRIVRNLLAAALHIPPTKIRFIRS